MVNVSSGRVRN